MSEIDTLHKRAQCLNPTKEDLLELVHDQDALITRLCGAGALADSLQEVEMLRDCVRTFLLAKQEKNLRGKTEAYRFTAENAWAKAEILVKLDAPASGRVIHITKELRDVG